MKRCPSCKSVAVVVYEIAASSIPLVQTVGGNWRREMSTPDWHVSGHEGFCRDCRHEWKFRKDPTRDDHRWLAKEGELVDPDVAVGRKPRTRQGPRKEAS